MKDRLIFDTTDATTRAETDNVGAYLRASDGTLLTHTDVSGKKALDVRLAEGVNVEVDLSHTDDSVRLGDGTNFFTSTSENGDIALDVHISNSDLDIRDLDYTQDSIEVFQATHDNLNLNANLQVGDADVANGNPVPISDAGGSITVDGTVTANQGTSPWVVSDAALANTAIASAAETLDVADTAQNVVASPLANRKYLYIYNRDNQTIYIGQSGVTSSTGFPVSPSAYMELRAGSAIDIEFVSSKVNHEIRTLELS